MSICCCGDGASTGCIVMHAAPTSAFMHLRSSRPQEVGGGPRPAVLASSADLVADKMSGSTSPDRMHNMHRGSLLAFDQRRCPRRGMRRPQLIADNSALKPVIWKGNAD